MRVKIDKEVLKKIKEDLKLYFEFLEKYNQPREPQIKAKIDEFVEKESSIIRRIRFIEEIELKESRKNKKEKIKEDVVGTIPTKNRTKTIKKNPLLNFILSDRKAIKTFGNMAKTLIIRFFGLRRSLTTEAIYEWTRYRTDMETILFKPFSFIVNNGWRYLDRLSYNVCLSFATFIHSFVKHSLPLRHVKTDEQILVFDTCLPYYLQVITRDSYKTILIDAVKKTLPRISNIGNIKLIIPFLNEIIDITAGTKNFVNIILSIYMLHYRKYIDLQHLSKFFKLPSIITLKYNFHKKLKGVVKEEILKAKEIYSKANKSLFYIKPIDYELSFSSDRQNRTVRHINRICVTDRDIPTMDNVENRMSSNPFGFIEENLIGFFLRFVSGFIMTYNDVLVDSIYIKSTSQRKKVMIFSEHVFGSHINVLKQVLNSYQSLKQRSEFSTIDIGTFNKYLRKEKIQSDREIKLCEYTNMALNTFFKFRDKLTEIMYNHFIASSLRGAEILEAQKEKDIPISEIMKSIPRFLPYASDTVIINRYHEGKTVSGLINEIIMILSNIAYLFEETQTMKILDKEEEFVKQCEESLLLISKIS